MKDAFFVARLHPKEYADYCASMRESNKVSDTAEKETERLKMMRDAGISEGSNGASSFTGKGSSADLKIAASEDASAPSSSADGDGCHPSSGVTVKLEGETVVKIEYQAKKDVDINPSAASSASNGVSFSEGSTEKSDEGSESLRVDTSAEGESMDCDAKDDELDAPPQTPSGPGSGAMTPAGSRSSRRVKGRGAKAETTVSEETEDKDSDSSEIAIGVAKKDCESDNPELVLSESKISEEDTPLQNSNVSAASGQIVKDEMSQYIKAEDDGKPAVDDFSSGEGAEASVKSDFEASSSSSSSRPPLFAIPGTTKVEIIKGVFLTDDTEDVDDTLESEHFDTRQSFLNLCQGNHYQFDQLRRAKHTSMMVLYHMHNPDAPKFVPNCNMCHKDILIGHKYRCEPCEQDYCPACYSLHGIRIHAHPLRPMAVSAMVTPPALTDEQRRQRQQAIDLHLTLLVHASSCVLGSDCKSRHCQKMKVSTSSHNKLFSIFCFSFSLYTSPNANLVVFVFRKS
jgi:hypothetical protein